MGKDPKLNTLVLDPKEGFGLEHVEDPRGHLWNYGGKSVYLMKRADDGVLTPVDLPEMGEPPEKLYRALFWKKLSKVLFKVENPLLEKLKTIGIYVLIAVLLFFIFLIFSSL